MRSPSIQRVVILGAGPTGAALAIHLVNLNLSVTLMDTTALLASEAIDAQRGSLYVPERAGEIRTLGYDGNLDCLSEAEWIVEALPPSLDEKRALYRRIAHLVRPDATVTTCESGHPIPDLVDGMPDAFVARFLGAYFARPLDTNRMVELRPGPLTDPYVVQDFEAFLAESAARRVVLTSGVEAGIAVGYGHWCVLLGIHVAERLRIAVEDFDAITGRLLGRPLGVFETADAVGLTILRDEAENVRAHLSNERAARILVAPNSLTALIARGWTGDHSGRGYYRAEGREHLTLDLTTMTYRQARDADLPGLNAHAGDLKTALVARGEVGETLREYLVTSLRYAEALRTTMGLAASEFDRVLEWGFGWPAGPFALLDHLGIGAEPYYKDGGSLVAPGRYAPIRPEAGGLVLDDCPIIDATPHYTIHDLGDGIEAVALAEGALTRERLAALRALLARPSLERFVLTSQGKSFPTLDLAYLLESFRTGGSAEYLSEIQALGEALEGRACVAALAGSCTGPGLGLALSCTAIVALADTSLGFDEARLGILPTARGIALMRRLHGESAKALGEIGIHLAEGLVVENSELARETGFLRPTDVTEHLPERLLATAKALVKTLAPSPGSELPAVEGPVVGIIERGLGILRTRGTLSEHGLHIGQRIAHVLARSTTYNEALERERRDSVDFGTKALTQARIRHMIETGRPLRN